MKQERRNSSSKELLSKCPDMRLSVVFVETDRSVGRAGTDI